MWECFDSGTQAFVIVVALFTAIIAAVFLFVGLEELFAKTRTAYHFKRAMRPVFCNKPVKTIGKGLGWIILGILTLALGWWILSSLWGIGHCVIENW